MIRINLELDPNCPESPEQLQALSAFLAALAGGTLADVKPAAKKRTTKKTVDAPPAEDQDKAEALVEPPEGETVEPPETEPEVGDPEKTPITRELIKEELQSRMPEHKAAMKTKLGELGSPNLTKLEDDKLEEFYNFILSL